MEKILILTNSINGLYNFRRELVDRLIQDGFEVIISAPIDEKTDFFTKLGTKNIATPINSRGKNPLSDIKLLIKYIKILKAVKPNVVLSYTIKPNVYGGLACRLFNIPILANITGLGSAVEKKGLLQNITLFLYRVSLRKASCIFFQNEENQKFFTSKNIGTDTHKLIPGSGVNLEHFKVLDYPDEREVNFLFIARIIKEKGIDKYLEAAEYIRGKYPYTRFHIIVDSDEQYNNRLIGMQNKGIVTYHGRQNDVREFHKISHCTIHPTYYPEGMSNVLLESAASGRPIITTNRAGCREVVNDNVNGYIAEQKNSEDLIKKIEDFLRLDYKDKIQMGLEGRKKVEREFDRQIIVNAYMTEISSIIENTE